MRTRSLRLFSLTSQPCSCLCSPGVLGANSSWVLSSFDLLSDTVDHSLLEMWSSMASLISQGPGFPSSFLAALFYTFSAFIFYFLTGGFPRARPGARPSSVCTLSLGQVLCPQGFYHLLEGSGPASPPLSWTAPLGVCNTSKRIYHPLSGQTYSPLPRRGHHYHYYPLRCPTRSPYSL